MNPFYMPNRNVLDSILVGYYEAPQLNYAVSAPLVFHRSSAPYYCDILKIKDTRCPFLNLPATGKERCSRSSFESEPLHLQPLSVF